MTDITKDNIDDWSVSDILELLDLTDPNAEDITTVSNKLITKAMNDGSISVSTFLTQARDKVLDDISAKKGDADFSEQAGGQLLNWMQNQSLTQNNTVQTNKTTSRKNKVQIFNDNSNFQMKQETLGINQVYNVPIAQGTINPNQTNTIERTVIIDSQYRSNVLPWAGLDVSLPSFNTMFSVNLSDPLSNVISMELYSVQIPKTWYNISTFIGNSCFTIYSNDSTPTYTTISVPSGHYTADTICTTLTTLLTENKIIVTYDQVSNKIYITGEESNKYSIDWFPLVDPTGICNPCITTMFVNNNLGWVLGFRNIDPDNASRLYIPYNDISPVKYWAEAAPALSGPQYLMLVVDDFNNNRLNKGIISTVDTQTKLDVPGYSNCSNMAQNISGKGVAVMTAPRNLTQAQLYAINTINQNRQEKKYRNIAPTTNDVLAVIPVSKADPGETILAYGVNMASNSRDYFGPVTIERLGIKLVDDKGNLIDLNGVDWSFTFRVKQLYQY